MLPETMLELKAEVLLQEKACLLLLKPLFILHGEKCLVSFVLFSGMSMMLISSHDALLLKNQGEKTSSRG